MSLIPVQFLIATFQDENAAKRVLDQFDRARVAAESIRTDIAHDLEVGHEVVLTAVNTGDMVAVERIGASEVHAEVTGVAMADSDVVGYAADITSTPSDDAVGADATQPPTQTAGESQAAETSRPETS